MLNPEVARLRGSRASNVRWANVADRTAATAKMRAGFIEKLQREVRQQLGPNTTADQVAKAVDSALKAHYAKMRLNSLLARRRVADEKRQAETEALASAILSESGPDESARGADESAV